MWNRIPSIEPIMQHLDQEKSAPRIFLDVLGGLVDTIRQGNFFFQCSDTLISIENVQSHSLGTSNADQFLSIHPSPLIFHARAQFNPPQKYDTLLID